MKIFDYKNVLISMVNLLTKQEKAFLVSGKQNGPNSLELEEYFDMEQYISTDENDIMLIDKRFMFAALKGFAKDKRIFIFIHSHPQEEKGELQFSAADDKFYIALKKVANKLRYERPLIFGIINEQDVIFKGFDKNGSGIRCSIGSEYENYSDERYAVKILFEKNFKNGVIYHIKNNEAKSISREMAEKMSYWEREYKEGKLSVLEKMIYKKVIADAFPSIRNRSNLSRENYLQTREIDNLEFMIQLGCNLKCKYCYADSGTYCHEKNIIMTESVACKLIDKLLNSGIRTIKNIFFFGGEPALFPKVIKGICHYCEELNDKNMLTVMPSFTMITNATYMDEELLDTIIKYNIKTTVSIDGPKEINDSLRITKEGKGTFEIVSANIEKMRKKNAPPVMIEATYTTMHEQKGMSRDEVRKWLKGKFKVKTVYIGECEKCELEPQNKLDLANDVINRIKETMVLQEGTNLDIAKQILNIQKALGRNECKNNMFCIAGYKMLCVLGNGDYYPCHQFIRKVDYKIGNLLEINQKLNIAEYDNKNYHVECRKCWAKEFCNECTWNIFSQGICEEKCEQNRKIIAYILLSIANFSEKPKKNGSSK